ncbi:MAG: ADP-ribosylation factor-like protein [Candidatus Hodarchaeales archaeon]
MSLSKVKIIFSGLTMSGVSSITSLFATGCYRGSDIWYSPNEKWTRINRKVNTLSINLFDLSGETSFLDKATTDLGHFIFKETTNLVFIIDLYEAKKLPEARDYLEKELDCLARYSPNVNLYIFLNKIDLISSNLQQEVIQTFKDYLNENTVIESTARYFITSLYTGSIFITFNELFWDILNSSSLNMYLSDFKREFWSLTESEIQDIMKKIMCFESTSNLSIFRIGNAIIELQDNLKELVESQEQIFLEFGEGTTVDKSQINKIKYSLFQTKVFQKILAFFLLFEMNEQTWRVIPIFDMLLENFIQRRFQGEKLSVVRDLVTPILPYLTQPSKFIIKSQQNEEIEKFSVLLNTQTMPNFNEISLKELLIKFAKFYIQNNDEEEKRKEESSLLGPSDVIPVEQLPFSPSSPRDSSVTQQISIQQQELLEEDTSEEIEKKDIEVDLPQQVPTPPPDIKSSISQNDEVDILSLPIRDVLRILRDKE